MDFESCYRAAQSKDPRFDGWFFTAVTSTGIYCRPSCPAMTPKASNVGFYPSAAAAQAAGFRACRRCRPEAVPGSPEWDQKADVAGRAMKLIADGTVDREGVAGLARRLGYSERQLNRQLIATLGAGPLALARAQRASTARILIETTSLPFAQVAFGAGFASVRQFNDTVRDAFGATPSDLRAKRRKSTPIGTGTIPVRLTARPPLDLDGLWGYLAGRLVPGVEELVDGVYRRTLDLPRGAGIVSLRRAGGAVDAELRLDDLRDLAAAVQRCRRLLDLDADPVAVDERLGGDEVLAPLVAKAPGTRVPGTVDGDEFAMRAILGQQVSVAGARTMLGRLTATAGRPLPQPDGTLTHLFPTAPAVAAWAEGDAPGIGITGARRRTLAAVTRALSTGDLALDPGVDRERAVASLLALPGIGPWTAGYVALRALRDPDVFPATDLGIRKALESRGVSGACDGEAWRPWRSYAAQYLWNWRS
jgi:AraC family transcriptional regulator of adaptative response / DNA-3-methyladenine glycosylase II